MAAVSTKDSTPRREHGDDAGARAVAEKAFLVAATVEFGEVVSCGSGGDVNGGEVER